MRLKGGLDRWKPGRRNAADPPLRDGGLRDIEGGGNRRHAPTNSPKGENRVHALTLSRVMVERKPLRMTRTHRVCSNGLAGGIQAMPAKHSKLRPLTSSELALLDWLQEALGKAGVSWGEAALLCGKSANLGNQWSTRRSCPVQRDVETIAQRLGIRMAWLLTGDEPSEETQARTIRELEVLRTLRDMPDDQQRAALAAIRAIKDTLTKK